MKKKNIKIITILIVVLIILGTIALSLVWNGKIILNDYFIDEDSVKGIDVSSYQGEIQWEVISNQNISFAFIKSTEGSSFVDENFDYNFEQAKNTSLDIGAYHFFSYDSDGKTQAENFISNVVPFEGMLPPVIDLEFYGDKEQNPPDRAKVEKQLKIMLDLLEEHYGQKPIIYATEKSYQMYLLGDYSEYDIWIRNVITKPNLLDERQWTFWQYTNREKLDGYNGEEKYIDVNVFNGDIEEYKLYLESNTYKPRAGEDSNANKTIPYPLELIMTSGAGAWYSSITINSDGSFTGEHHNSEAGLTGEDYPEGTVYGCEYEGKFTNIRQIDDYTFSLTLESITTDHEQGYYYIKNGMRIETSPAYGLLYSDNTKPAKEFLLYTPETPIDKLSEGFLFYWPFRYDRESTDSLSCYGLYNIETEDGFFTMSDN